MKLSQAIEIFTQYKSEVGDVDLVEFLNGTVLGSRLRFALAQNSYVKGKTHDLTYNSWIAMIKRCFDTTHPEYARYGGSNILPCVSWLKYENFLNDVGQRPNKDATLDRIDGTKGYYKENCRWASKAQQSNNTRRNIKVNLPEFSGTLAQACVFFNMPYDCVRKRLKRGVSIEDALKTPLQPGRAMRQTVWVKDRKVSGRLTLPVLDVSCTICKQVRMTQQVVNDAVQQFILSKLQKVVEKSRIYYTLKNKNFQSGFSQF